jgi:hypothetical protein
VSVSVYAKGDAWLLMGMATGRPVSLHGTFVVRELIDDTIAKVQMAAPDVLQPSVTLPAYTPSATPIADTSEKFPIDGFVMLCGVARAAVGASPIIRRTAVRTPSLAFVSSTLFFCIILFPHIGPREVISHGDLRAFVWHVGAFWGLRSHSSRRARNVCATRELPIQRKACSLATSGNAARR